MLTILHQAHRYSRVHVYGNIQRQKVVWHCTFFATAITMGIAIPEHKQTTNGIVYANTIPSQKVKCVIVQVLSQSVQVAPLTRGKAS